MNELIGESVITRSEAAQIEDSYIISGDGTSITRSQTVDPLMYVVNFMNEAGFALIAAAKVEDPIMGLSYSGRFDPNKIVDNPGFEFFIDLSIRYLKAIANDEEELNPGPEKIPTG